MHKKSNFVLLDTTGLHEDNKFKIKGANPIPFAEIIDRRKELASYDETIVYCKNTMCLHAKTAAMGLKLLKIKNVKIYEGGIDEWIAYNLPVEEKEH